MSEEPTTREERTWLSSNMEGAGLSYYAHVRTWLAGSDRAHDIIRRLIADVDRLERPLAEREAELARLRGALAVVVLVAQEALD